MQNQLERLVRLFNLTVARTNIEYGETWTLTPKGKPQVPKRPEGGHKSRRPMSRAQEESLEAPKVPLVLS